MQVEIIKNLFEGRKGKAVDIHNYYAVLVPIMEVDDKPHLLYQVRSHTMSRQPGEVSFPGGRIEKGESSKEAAIRETKEEMGIDTDGIELIGELDTVLNQTNDMIYPFLGYLPDVKLEEIQYSNDEVSDIFTVPVEFFLNNKPQVYDMSYKVSADELFPFHKIGNSKAYETRIWTCPVYFYEYHHYIIWGLTAKITRNFIVELNRKINEKK